MPVTIMEYTPRLWQVSVLVELILRSTFFTFIDSVAVKGLGKGEHF